ncbi:hypothetical protein GGI04_005621, partial [Coemansia thaxteri]
QERPACRRWRGTHSGIALLARRVAWVRDGCGRLDLSQQCSRDAAGGTAALRLVPSGQWRRSAAGHRGMQDQEPKQLFHRPSVPTQGQRVGIQASVPSHHREAGAALRRPAALRAETL